MLKIICVLTNNYYICTTKTKLYEQRNKDKSRD